VQKQKQEKVDELINMVYLCDYEKLLLMPCIKRIDANKVYIYLRDHNPPHFHVIYAEYEELITIRSLENYNGNIPKAQRKKVIDWAESNQDYLIEKWNEFNPNNRI